MDKINFKQLNQYLKAEIQGESSLQKNDLFGIVLGKISVYACRILNLRNVAYRNILSGENAEQRNEYFSSIEGILALLYADFPNLKFESRVKLYMTRLIIPKSGVERSEVIQKLQSYLPKLETSWVDVAGVWNHGAISWRSYRFASFFIFKKSDFLNFILDFSLVIFISYQRYFYYCEILGMKILKSFDTKIDAEELVEAVNKYGEGNVILVKKHWVKLITPLLLVFLAMFMLDFLLYVIYEHLFDEHKVIFWILAIFYVYTTFSWCLYAIIGILTNIIGQIKAEKKYIDSTKLAKLKQASFEKFLKRSLITFVAHVLVLIFNAIVPFVVIETTGIGSIAITVGALILDVLFLLTLNRVMYRIIDYEMNFNICTTDGFVSYNQDGFFRTNTKNISASAIKVIQASKDGLKGALWQYGKLYIHTDGDLNNVGGKILELSYIPDPKRLAKKINAMLEATRGNDGSINKIPVVHKEVISQ